MDQPSNITSDNSNSTSTSITTAAIGNSNPNNRDQFLHHLNKLSHKISKPGSGSGSLPKRLPVEPVIQPPPAQQQQPPVYNINKSDFRDVVQKLTGSPAHAPSPPIHAPKPASSRLQRIRPPPLAQLSSLPQPLLSSTGQGVPHSPLPPLPSCHAAAESPISAYMRFLHGSMPPLMFPPPETLPAPGGESLPPVSSFGCAPSPKSPCPRILPVSPVASPKWRDV